jgi:hypothetical protein
MIADDFAWHTSVLGAIRCGETRWLSLMSALLLNSGTRRRSETSCGVSDLSASCTSCLRRCNSR